MIHFPDVRARGFTLRMRELTFGQAIDIASRPQHLEHANTTAFLRYVSIDPETDPSRWRVGERTLAVAHYLACVLNDPDFPVGEGRYSDYLVPEDAPVPEFVDLGSVLGETWRMRHLDGRLAEAIERLNLDGLSGRGRWLTGMAAGQLYREGEDAPADMTDGQLDEWLEGRAREFCELPESEFEALLMAYLRGRDALTHLFRIDADDAGLLCLPTTEDAGLPPARFPFRACVGPRARAMAREPD